MNCIAKKKHKQVSEGFIISVPAIEIANCTDSCHWKHFRVGLRGPEHPILFHRAFWKILKSGPLKILILHKKRKIKKSKNMAAFQNRISRPLCFQKCKIHQPFAEIKFSMEKLFFSKNVKIVKRKKQILFFPRLLQTNARKKSRNSSLTPAN